MTKREKIINYIKERLDLDITKYECWEHKAPGSIVICYYDSDLWTKLRQVVGYGCPVKSKNVYERPFKIDYGYTRLVWEE